MRALGSTRAAQTFIHSPNIYLAPTKCRALRKRATKTMMIQSIHYHLPLTSWQLRCPWFQKSSQWDSSLNKTVKVHGKFHGDLEVGKLPNHWAQSRGWTSGWWISEWLDHRYSSWNMGFFEEMPLEIGPLLEDITKIGHVFTWRPQSSQNVLAFYCDFTS